MEGMKNKSVWKAINHEGPDCIPIDLGSTLVTGIAASTYAKLRQALGLARSPVIFLPAFHPREFLQSKRLL